MYREEGGQGSDPVIWAQTCGSVSVPTLGGEITICHQIQVPDRLIICHIPILVSDRSEQSGLVRFGGCVGGFCSAGPLPPLGGIITTLGAQHPFGAFSNSPISNSFWQLLILWNKLKSEWKKLAMNLDGFNLLRGSCWERKGLGPKNKVP